jgi:hypothetical protein
VFQCARHVTTAVVALFNAIAKAKRDTVAAEEAASNKKSATLSASTTLGGSASSNNDDGSIISRESVKKSVAGKKGEKASAPEGEGKPKQWAALRDDYLVGEKLTVKVSLQRPIHVCVIYILLLWHDVFAALGQSGGLGQRLVCMNL